MKPLNCARALRRLEAFHDGELGLTDQIAVAAHLEWCDSCAQALAELRAVGAALQTFSHRRAVHDTAGLGDEALAFNAVVVARARAERDASAWARMKRMFDDAHLVYAAFGAAASAIACVIIVLGMLSFASAGHPDASAPFERADALAAMQSSLANLALFECDAMGEAGGGSMCRERRLERAQRANELAQEDAVFALDLVLTRQGRLGTLQALTVRARYSHSEAELIAGLLDAVSRSRFGSPPGVSISPSTVARVVTSATFRTGQPMDVPLPPMKKRAA